MRITTPPKSLLPLYRTHSNPELASERTVILQRTQAAQQARNLEAEQSLTIMGCAALFFSVATVLMYGLISLIPRKGT